MSSYSCFSERCFEKYRFGFEFMGPILTECCHILTIHLNGAVHKNDYQSKALFCSRGGLILRRALECFLDRTEQSLLISKSDFMVSRLAASRLALEVNPDRAAPLLAMEFGGRSCADVASVLSGLNISNIGDWAKPYCFERFFNLMINDSIGRCARDLMIEQAGFLRSHIQSISGGSTILHIVDTGVFGSIGHYLKIGLPEKSLQSVLLFRANYKGLDNPTETPTIGLVCDLDSYSPWAPRSVSRLYWPLIEAFFEPDLPSVRYYRRLSTGEVQSNLEQLNWQERLNADVNPIRAGAFDYIDTLLPEDVAKIVERSTDAWKGLQNRIIYPTTEDVMLLGVTKRGLDFGFVDEVDFGKGEVNWNPCSIIAEVRNSVWPEGEIRRLFPFSAPVWLHLLEAKRKVISYVGLS